MDYNQLAKEFGGVAEQPTKTSSSVDYASLAKEFGGAVAEGEKQVDYTKLAEESGGALASRGTGDLLSSGTEAGITGIKQMGEGLSLLRNVSALDRVTSAFATYDAIDRGEIKSPAEASQKGLNATSAAKYLRATPEARIKMRENQFTNEDERKALLSDSVKMFKQYQKEMAAQGKGVPNFTDIESMDGFRQWLTFNLPSTAIQLAPIMVAAVTTGGVGAFTVGAGMATGETVGNRLEFILDKTKGLSPEEQADKVEEYIRSTRDTTMAVALASGALDLAGPVGTILRNRAKKEGIKYLTKKEAAKAGLKEAPRAIAEEAVTGAGQESLQILGEKKLEEMEGDLLSKKNLKRVVDAAAVEALGGKVGATINTGVQVADTGLRQRAERKQQEAIDETLRQAAVDSKRATLGPEYSALVDKYIAEGKSETEAFQLAGKAMSEREVEGERGEPGAGGVDTGVSVPSGEEVDTGVAAAPEGAKDVGVADTGEAADGSGVRARELDRTLESYRDALVAEYGVETADQIIARATELATDGADPKAAIDAATTEATEVVEEAPTKAPVVEGDFDALAARFDELTERTDELDTELNNTYGGFPGYSGFGLIKRYKTAREEDPKNLDKYDQQLLDDPKVQEYVEKSDELKAVGDQINALVNQSLATKATPQAEADVIETAEDTADAADLNVDTEADVAQINPETGLKPPGKRGRKKVERTPEEQAAYEKQRRAAQGASRDAGRTVDRAEKTLAAPFDEGQFETEQALAAGKEARDAEVIEALTDLFRITNNPSFRKNKPGTKARELIDQFPKNDRRRVIAEARSKLGTEAAPSFGLAESTNSNIDPNLEQFDNTGDVLRYIIKTGNAFEKLLAQRILPFVKDIPIAFIPDITQAVSSKNRSKVRNAAGIYLGAGGNRGAIFISTNPDTDGRSNMTILHEALHGATLARIRAFLADPKSVSAKTQQAMVELFETMNAAGEFYQLIKARADADPAVAQRFSRMLRNADFFASKDVFTNVAEFIAYGMSQPEFQEFLVQVPGRFRQGVSLYKNLFTRFVTAIRDIFNLGPQHDSALQDLIIVSDKLLSSPEILAIEGTEVLPASKPKPAKKAKVDRTTEKIARSNKYSDMNASIGELMKEVRNADDALKLLKSAYGAMSVGAVRKAMFVLTTMDITRWAGDKIANLKNVNRAVQEMAGMRARMIRELAEKVPAWVNFAKAHEQAARMLGDLMHRATLTQVDPSKYGSLNDALQNDPILKANEAKSQDMNLTPNQRRFYLGEATKRKNDITRAFDLWDKLGKVANGKAHDIYRMAKETYLDTFNLHQKILLDKIAASDVPGDVNDASTPKGKLMASITKSFQDAASMDIYFPLMRYGNYWLRVGKGKKGEFYMFETATARNNARRKRVEEMQKAGDKRSYDEIVEAGDIDFGDDLRQMRAEIVESSQMLKAIFKMLDTNKLTDVEALKDQVYQMYLMTLPEKDIRKRFTHRQGKTGFSADVIRNFIVSQHTAANQLARLKYSDQIRNAIGASYAELAGNPDKLKLSAFVDEVAARAGNEITPPIAGQFDFDKLASVGNQVVFYYMLTSPKSALVQLTQLPTVGLPVLLANYDATEVAKTVGRYSNLFNKLGVHKRDDNGNVTTEWSQPSIRDSNYVNKHPDINYRRILRNAWEYANDNDLFMSTYTADMTSMAQAPTAEYRGWMKTGTRAVLNLMAGAFHHTERIARETMYMSTFELEFAKQKKAGKSDAEAALAAKQKAVDIVYESLFNYTQYNKPRIMKTPAGRIATQFLSYPLQVTSYLFRNFKNMLPFLNKEGKREAAIMFFGTVGMTGMFSGVVGLPLYSLMMGMVDKYRELMRPEEDEDYDEDDEGNPLGRRSTDLWFREWFIPTYFGEGSSLAKALGLTDEQAETLARSVKMGPVSAITNLNIGASVSLDGLWFRDDTPSNDSKSAVQEMFFNLFGGPLGSGVQQVASGWDDFNNGQWERGLEKWLPAFFRGAMKAYRMNTEGLKTTKGDEVKNSEYYTTGRLVAQAMGFEPTEVADVQKANFMAKRLETQIMKERASLLNKLDIAVRRNEERMTDASEKAIEDAIEAIEKYNAKNGFGAFLITQETVEESIKGREKRRGQSYQGLSVPPKAAPFIYPLVEKGRSPEYQ